MESNNSNQEHIKLIPRMRTVDSASLASQSKHKNSISKKFLIILMGIFLLAFLVISTPSANKNQSNPNQSESLDLRTGGEKSKKNMVNCSAFKKFQNERPRVQYIHIPKAGGTTIQNTFDMWARKYYLDSFIHDGGGPFYEPTKVNHDIFLGHRGYGFSQKVSNLDNVIYIVSVREPISRLISLFDYIMASPFPPFVNGPQQWWKGKSLESILEDYHQQIESGVDPASFETSNDIRTIYRLMHQQTNYLCGFDCVRVLTGDPMEKDAQYRSSPCGYIE